MLPVCCRHQLGQSYPLVERSHLPQILRFSLQSRGRTPNAQSSFYEGVGHIRFWEDAPLFNRELAAFVANPIDLSQAQTNTVALSFKKGWHRLRSTIIGAQERLTW